MTSANDMGILLVGIAACISTFTYLNKPDARFEAVQLGTMRADQFLVDKGSGRIWEKVCMGESDAGVCKGRLLWEEMFVSSLTPPRLPCYGRLQKFYR